MNVEEKAELLSRTINELAGRTAVVEGRRDAEALKEAGVRARAVIAAGKPERIVEKAGPRVVLLFDFDEEGERKAKVFFELFRAAGAEVDLLSRKRFRQALGIRTFEELPAKIRELEEKKLKKKVV